jgi:hypothetical protein
MSRGILSVGDVIRGNGKRALGREILRIVDLDLIYAYCTVPGMSKALEGDNMIRLGRAHIHTDGMERRIGWDRVARASERKAA